MGAGTLTPFHTTQLTQAKLTAVRYVANAIMSQHALLLPQVSKVFLKAYQPTTGVESNDINIDTGDGTIRFTSNWLLNQLVLYLHQHELQVHTQEVWYNPVPQRRRSTN